MKVRGKSKADYDEMERHPSEEALKRFRQPAFRYTTACQNPDQWAREIQDRIGWKRAQKEKSRIE